MRHLSTESEWLDQQRSRHRTARRSSPVPEQHCADTSVRCREETASERRGWAEFGHALGHLRGFEVLLANTTKYKATSDPPVFMAPRSECATPRHTTLLLLLLFPAVCLLCACASPYLRVSFRSSAPLTTEALREAAPLTQSSLLTLAPD
ncbi:hypothetical protein O3P69_012360 [Scylla paramamosain]|uniref:Uncharacterized protein n=1 Tax=Scylla paramamosain TaxID=85552 RepID=A0AAW0SCT9_SCYPA